METIIISSKKPLDVYKKIKSIYPNAVHANVCAFGIVTNWYENENSEKLIAQELYTKIKDNGSFLGVETKLIIY